MAKGIARGVEHTQHNCQARRIRSTFRRPLQRRGPPDLFATGPWNASGLGSPRFSDAAPMTPRLPELVEQAVAFA